MCTGDQRASESVSQLEEVSSGLRRGLTCEDLWKRCVNIATKALIVAQLVQSIWSSEREMPAQVSVLGEHFPSCPHQQHSLRVEQCLQPRCIRRTGHEPYDGNMSNGNCSEPWANISPPGLPTDEASLSVAAQPPAAAVTARTTIHSSKAPYNIGSTNGHKLEFSSSHYTQITTTKWFAASAVFDWTQIQTTHYCHLLVTPPTQLSLTCITTNRPAVVCFTREPTLLVRGTVLSRVSTYPSPSTFILWVLLKSSTTVPKCSLQRLPFFVNTTQGLPPKIEHLAIPLRAMAISQSYKLLGPHLHDVGRLMKAADSGGLGHLLKSSISSYTNCSSRFASPISCLVSLLCIGRFM